MKSIWVIFSFFICLISPKIIFADQELRFYFLNDPILHNINGKPIEDVPEDKIFKEMGLTPQQAFKLLGPKKTRPIVIPENIVSKNIYPKIGENLWVFYKSKLRGATKVTKVYFSYGPNDVYNFVFEILNLKHFQTSTDEFYSACVSVPGIMVNVPESTSPNNLPKEFKVDPVICKKLLKILKPELPRAVIDQTFMVMGQAYIVVVDDKGTDSPLTVYVYKVIKNGFKKVYEKSVGVC